MVILFVGLNLWPCNDPIIEDSCGSEIHYHTSNNQESDHCSPFCQCYCCHIQIANTHSNNFSDERSLFSVIRVFISNRTGQKFSDSLFEPPQV